MRQIKPKKRTLDREKSLLEAKGCDVSNITQEEYRRASPEDKLLMKPVAGEYKRLELEKLKKQISDKQLVFGKGSDAHFEEFMHYHDFHEPDFLHPQLKRIPYRDFSAESVVKTFKEMLNNLPFELSGADSLINRICDKLDLQSCRRKLVFEPPKGFVIMNISPGDKSVIVELEYVFYEEDVYQCYLDDCPDAEEPF